MDLQLKGKNAIVTGASSGIGKATAIELAKFGANVVVAARREEKLKSVMEEINAKKQGRCVACRTDVTSLEDNQALVKKCVDEFGSLDIVFLNAGVPILKKEAPLWEYEEKQWDLTMSVNLTGLFKGVKACMPQFIKQKKGGCIVINVSATAKDAGIEGFAKSGGSPYAISKCGALGVVNYLAVEAAKYNVRVNGIAPGTVETEQTKGKAQQAAKDFQLLKRAVTPDEIAAQVAILASPATSSFVTGSLRAVDGGFMTK